MRNDETAWARRAAMLVALCAGGAVAAQAGLNIASTVANGGSALAAALALYGYFTIWSNTLVALIAARYAVRGETGGLLTRPGTMAAATVYIVVVGAIYNLLLSRYNPVAGVRLVIDMMLHGVVPVAYTLWWLVLVPRRRLAWNSLWLAMVFPFAYCIVALVRGQLTGKYAYFFIDIGNLGWGQVMVNVIGLVLFFTALMALVIAFDRWAHGRQSVVSPV